MTQTRAILLGAGASADLVAKPEAVEGGYVAVSGNYATHIIAIEGSEIADLLANPTPNTGPLLAQALSGAIDGLNASFRQLNVEVAGMTGIGFKIDGSGPGGRGQLRLVSSGGGGLAFICGTKGSFGVGKRIKRLNSEVCPHFFSSAGRSSAALLP